MVGNISNYTRFDILRCFLKLSDQPKSRLELSKSLEIGEGTMRTILDELKEKSLASSIQNGHMLTRKGLDMQKSINSLIEIRNNLELPFYQKYRNTALLMKTGKSIKFDIFQRDTAIKNGADSCLILIFDGKKLNLPLLKQEYDLKAFNNAFRLEKNNMVIVTFAKSNRWTEISALSLVCKLKKGLFSRIC